MRAALDAASRSGADDVPIGAVVYDPDGVELARAANRREADSDPTARRGPRSAGSRGAFGDGWRLSGCTLVVTVEPCTMCAGAITLSGRPARVRRVGTENRGRRIAVGCGARPQAHPSSR